MTVIVSAPPAGPAVPGRVRRGSAGHRSSGRPPVARAGHPGTTARARARAPVRVIASSTAVSTTARVRRAISSAVPLRFNGSASTWRAAAIEDGLGRRRSRRRPRPGAPECAGPRSRRRRGRTAGRHGARTAQPARATPIAPCQKPGRSRYSPGSPDGNRRGAAELHRAGVGLAIPGIAPRAGQRPDGVVAQIDRRTRPRRPDVQPRGHQRVRAQARARAPRLGAVELDLVTARRARTAPHRATPPPTPPTAGPGADRVRPIRPGSRRHRCVLRPAGPATSRSRSARRAAATGGRSHPTPAAAGPARPMDSQCPTSPAVMSGSLAFRLNTDPDSSRR